MSLNFRKSKMVSFRLSQQEHQRLREMSVEHGERSISDLARTAVQKLLAVENKIDPLAYEVCDLRQQVHSLSLELERITRLIETRQPREEARTQ